jgi:hypothetical protein
MAARRRRVSRDRTDAATFERNSAVSANREPTATAAD